MGTVEQLLWHARATSTQFDDLMGVTVCKQTKRDLKAVCQCITPFGPWT